MRIGSGSRATPTISRTSVSNSATVAVPQVERQERDDAHTGRVASAPVSTQIR
jgi:hypothetical protein